MPSFCVVSNCEYKYTHSENVSFHKFPYNSPNILSKWIQFTDRGSTWKPSRWSAICSRHFLPSDFRNLISRKCLKKDAIPSITIKQFTGNFLDLQGDKGEAKLSEIGLQITEEQYDSNCRLCGICCKSVETFATNFEVFGMIQKCFPTLNIQQDDDLPKHLCSNCLDRLQSFSDFVDEVLNTQKDLELKFTNEQNELLSPDIGKPLKIKQEPVIKVKQEVNEGFQNSLSEEGENDFSDVQECEQKSQLQNHLPLINSQEIVNNCDIMEIISLDDAFIDIPDDEVADDISLPLESKMFRFVRPDEHNYAKAVDANLILSQPFYKVEITEDYDLKLQNSSKPPNIVVIDESIVKSGQRFACIQCDQCTLTFTCEADVTKHKNLHHSPKKRCAPCNLQFNSFYKFLLHKNKFHNTKGKRYVKKKKNVNCPLCEKIFSSKLALNNHRKYICDYQQEEEYKCKHCGTKLNRWILLRRHERVCRKVMKTVGAIQDIQPDVSVAAIKSPSTTKNSSRIPKIEPNDKGKFVCTICGRSYSRRNNLLKHQLSHRPQVLWNHKCGDCDKLFDRMYDLRRHLKSEECSKSSQKPQQIFFICTICGKELKSLQRLKQHNTLHSGKKPYVCESCGKSFTNVNNLYQHHITHSDVRRYKCDMCEKVFKRRGGLNQHKRAYHFKIKPHECPTCKHRYALKGDMIRCKHSLLRQN